MSCYGSAPMDISEDSSPWGSNPPIDPREYFTDSMNPNVEKQDPSAASLNTEPEDRETLSNFVTPPAVHNEDANHYYATLPVAQDESDIVSPSHCSAEHSPISEVRRSRFGETEAYQELRRLGCGGNGNCFLLKRCSDNALRVCKVSPLKTRRKQLKSQKCIPLEARILQDILPPHERIVCMHEVIITSRTTQIYLDYYDHGDLHALMDSYFGQDFLFAENFVWHCYQQLCEAVAYIHTGYNASTGNHVAPILGNEWTPIIHADIKPMNIFLKSSTDSSYPSLVLGDFGNSKTQPGTGISGTLIWTGPEIWEYSVQSDVWGVGAVISAMCHGGRVPMLPMPSHWASTKENVEAWTLTPSARCFFPLGPEYSHKLNRALEINLQLDLQSRPSSNDHLDWVNNDILERRKFYPDWHTIARKVPTTEANPIAISSKEPLGMMKQAAYVDLEYTYRSLFSEDHQNLRSLTQSLGNPAWQQELYPANLPPHPELTEEPRYLGSLPDRNAYWFQDNEGYWNSGFEPVQPFQDEIQPDDYSSNERAHDAWPTPFHFKGIIH